MTARAAPIFAFAQLSWDALWMNRQHLLSRLGARGHPVIYSNGLAHYSDAGRMPWLPRCEQRDGVTLARRGFIPPRTHRLSYVSRFSIRQHLRDLRRALAVRPGQDCIGLCFDPQFIDYVEIMRPTLRAFHIYDAYNRYTTADAEHVFVSLRQSLRDFDLITASSREMYEVVVGESPAEECIVPNGVDFAAVSTGTRRASATADAIRALPAPRIGYVGTLNTKVDFALVDALARVMPRASFVLVGPQRPDLLRRSGATQQAFTAMSGLPNVHLFPAVPHSEVPAVLDVMDVNCLFLRVGDDAWGSATYPLKLHEYLAVGRPVVSSPVTVVREEFADVVAVCTNVDEWCAAIEAAVVAAPDEDAVAMRRAVAEANDWARRVEQLEGLLERALSRKRGD